VAGVITLGELAERLGARLIGDGDCAISRVATLATAGAGDITFLANPRYRRQLDETGAAAVILAEECVAQLATNGLVVADPYLAYARVAGWLNPVPAFAGGVHDSAWVAPDSRVHDSAWIGPQAVVETGASIEAGCFIGPGCIVGRDAVIGADSRLVANVTIAYGCHLGRRAILHPGVVVGGDGFGLANDQGRWVKIPQLGKVVIGDDVEIGANTCVDRGAIDDTVIEEGVKLDNLIQVAHNVRIGAHTAIAGCSAIAGSARIGKHCAIGGGVGIVGHLEIADNVTITGMSLVTQSVTEPGVYSSGVPLEKNTHWHRNFVRFKQLDEMARRLKNLEQQIGQQKDG
jgi:UDP-3-O-[3-hydroxymyristoyl] glucosamine N-acyltransferase